jgi:hypothetical protein
VIVSVITVQMMEPPVMHIVHVSAVLHHLVFFARVPMGVIIACHAGHEFFGCGVRGSNFEGMFIDMPVMAMMKMSVVQKIDMPRVIDSVMAAACLVGVGIMRGVDHLMRGERARQQRQRDKWNKESCHG